ncbi:MAG: hypothetical protein O2979_04980 [Proteobacteria bacterium]|nr:hypothetical protein [Pseudomonadota bacterium]
MSATADANGHDDHPGARGGILRWITTASFFAGCADIACDLQFSQLGSPLWS